MKDKLELKHLAPYLPYGLKCCISWHENVIFNVTGANQDSSMQWVYTNIDDEYYSEGIEDSFPILHPLSDLTKHCDDLGFVPIHRLFEMWARNQKKDYHDYNIDDEPNFVYCTHNATAEVLQVYRSDIHFNSSWIVRQLQEWHFDTENLILSGLAIDVNTLETNPYA